MGKTSIRSGIAYSLSQWDYLGQKILWDDESRSPIGGLLSYSVPVLWIIYCIYAIAIFIGVQSFHSNSILKDFPTSANDTNFFLPGLTCISPRGCHISPLLRPDLSGKLDMIQSSCKSGLQTIDEKIQEKEGDKVGARPPVNSNGTEKHKRKRLLNEIVVDPGIVQSENSDTVLARDCIPLSCGDQMHLENDRTFYYDYDPYNTFTALWTNATFGFAMFVPTMNRETGEVTAKVVKLHSGVYMMQLIHQIHAYQGRQLYKFVPTLISSDGQLDTSRNICCKFKAEHTNAEIIGVSTGVANCSNPTIAQITLRASPTYIEETIQKQIIWNHVMGLSGGTLFLFLVIAKVLTYLGDMFRLREKSITQHQTNKGKKDPTKTLSENEVNQEKDIHDDDIRFFAPKFQVSIE